MLFFFFTFTSFSFFVFFCLKKQKQKLSDVVIPSTFSIVLCLRKLLQKYLQAGVKRQRLKRKNARRDLYNRLRRYPNKSKRQKGAFIVKLTVVLPKVGDGVTTWWREIGHRRHMQACRCAHICVEKHTHTHLQTHLKKRSQIQRERWNDSVILVACIHVYKRVYVTYVCVSRNGIPVSAALHSVSQQILIQIHHRELFPIISHSLWWLCLLQGYTVECHLKGLEGRLLLAALYQRICLKRGKRRRGWLPVCKMIGWNHIFSLAPFT